MSDREAQDRLSRISTMWTRIHQAHGDDTELATDAVIDMVEQYSGAVYRYLLAILRDQNAADEVFQEFALRLVQGCFHRAAPERGRFRDYLKVSVSRLVTDYYRRRKSERRERAVAGVEAVEESPADMGAQFESSWREELLSHAWRKLQELEVTSGQPYHAVLNYRAQRPKATSTEMAADLTQEFQPEHPFTDVGIRKTLQRARHQFADILLGEVERTLEDATREAVGQELIDLDLYSYCRSALEKRGS